MTSPSWTVGLSLIVLTIAIHTAVVVLMASFVMRIQVVADKQEHRDSGRAMLMVIGLIGAVGLILAVVHGLEAMIWAVAYRWLAAFGTLTDAFLYSMGTMTTVDTAGLALPRKWQMMSALEAVDGMLLFGISTAFIFTVMQQLWPMLSHGHSAKAPD